MAGNRKIKNSRAFSAALLVAMCLPSMGHAACGVTKTVKQAGGGDYVSISAAINLAQSSSPLKTDWCINIDSAVYSEQVIVVNITFFYSTNTLTLQTDPTLVSTQATVNPPASSTAAFQIANASMRLQNLAVISTNAVTYGVWASSGYVTLSNLYVSTQGTTGNITTAGIWISSNSVVSNSSVTAYNAYGLYVSGSSNTITQSFISNPAGIGAYFGTNAGYNTVSQSTMSGRGNGLRFYYYASSNTILQDYIFSSNDHAAFADLNADYNTIRQSTMAASGNGSSGLMLSGDYNTASQNYCQSQGGFGLWITGTHNSISQSSVTTTASGYPALRFTGSINTVSQCAIFQTNGDGVDLDPGANYNTISGSTITSDGNYKAADFSAASSNTITQSYISNSSGTGVYFGSGSNGNAVNNSYFYTPQGDAMWLSASNYNTISQSTVSASRANPALFLDSGASSNTFTQTYFNNLGGGNGGWAVLFQNNSNINFNTISRCAVTGGTGIHPAVIMNGSFNTITQTTLFDLGGYRALAVTSADHLLISQSTMTSAGEALYLDSTSSSSTVLNSYIQGSTAVYINGSTGTVIGGSVLVATNTFGSALELTGGSANLTLTSTTIQGGPQGAGIFMDPGNAGSIVLTSNTITGGRWGVYISTMNCGGTCTGANLSISSMIFAGGLTAGATAIHFAGGTFVSTFSFAAFNDPNIAVNVDGAPLSYGAGGSRITMRSYSGAKAGPSFEDDPNSVIDWSSGVNVPPSNPAISQVFFSSAAVSYGTVGASAYFVDASTASDFSGTLYSAADLTGSLSSLTPQGLTPNTSYYFRAGALWGAATFYADASPSYTVTLASTPFPLNFAGIGSNQFTVNWPAYNNPAGTVYTVDISTDIAYSVIAASASTTGLTATFTSLISNTAYYVRVRAFNSAGVPSPYALGAVFTAAGVITLSANFSTQTWYNSNGAVLNAQGPAGVTRFYYKVTANAGDLAAITDPWFSGASLGVVMPQGLYYFHVLGTDNSNTSFGTAAYGPVHIDTAPPAITLLTAQNSASDPTAIFNGGSTLSPIPHFMWTAASAVFQDPIQGYSYTISVGSATTPATFVTTTLGFWDAFPALAVPGLYYFSVRAWNLAGAWGPPVSMNFNFTTVPTVNNIILKSNYFNPASGTCMHLNVQITSPGHVKAELFTLLGRRVVTLADTDISASVQDYPWCGRNQENKVVATGVYLLRVDTPDQKKIFKVIVAK